MASQSSPALSLSSTKLPSILSSPAMLVCKLAVLPTLCSFILLRRGVLSSSSPSSSLSLLSVFESDLPGRFPTFEPFASFFMLSLSPRLRTFLRTPPDLSSSSSSSSSPFFEPREFGVGVPPLLPSGDAPFALLRRAALAPLPPIPRHFSRCWAKRVMSRLRLHDGHVCQGIYVPPFSLSPTFAAFLSTGPPVLGCSAEGEGGAVPFSLEAFDSAFILSRSFLVGGLSLPATGNGLP